MKELSIKEKAKRYDEVVARLRYAFNSNRCTLGFMNEILRYPRESEDERIRKELIEHVKDQQSSFIFAPDCRDKYEEEENNKYNSWLAWLDKQGEAFTKKDVDDAYLKGISDAKQELEKQDEQKPIDKVEPKFKVGDWIIYDRNISKVKDLDSEGYLVEDTYGDEGVSPKEFTEKHYRLWTIKDAKDGDVLHSTGLYSDCIFIYNGLDNWKFDEPNGNRAVATGYCCLSVSADNMEFGIQGPDCIEVNTVKPATKIQRDLLEKAMTDAGYRWNPDENKIEKIEQKPDWNKEDEEMLYSAIEYAQTYPAHRNSVVNWLKSLRPQNTWKPSKEQMDALLFVVQHYTPNVTDKLAWDSIKILELMHNDLKKL